MFAANINAAWKRVTLRGKPVTPLGLRAPMQILFIGLIWWASNWGSARVYALRSVSSEISGGTPIRTGKPNVPRPRFT